MSDLVLPKQLTYVAAMDWGHNKPGVIGWAALWGDHRIHVVREWKFVGQDDDQIAAGYHARTKALGVQVLYVAGDPSMWIRDGRGTRGQSRAETLMRARMPLRKAENARVDGWSRLHTYLAIPKDDDGAIVGDPLLTVDAACKYLIRTIPAQRSDKTDADDVDTSGDDHGVDMLRYLVMSRPAPVAWRTKQTSYHPELEKMLAGASASPVLGSDLVRER